MDVSSFRAQLESELAWRVEELLFFQNLGSALDRGKDDQYRRALILLLYSHFEGFCKFALGLYVDAVNQANIQCGTASFAIAAASLHQALDALRDHQRKAPEFRNSLPDDSALHRFARDREFVERASEIMSRTVSISHTIVDTESNLWPVVLRKNLYKLGLPHERFISQEGKIKYLLEQRNQIAHGETKQGVERKSYERMRDSALRIMSDVASGITDALANKAYLNR